MGTGAAVDVRRTRAPIGGALKKDGMKERLRLRVSKLNACAAFEASMAEFIAEASMQARGFATD